MSLRKDYSCSVCLEQLPYNRVGCDLMCCCGNWIHKECSEAIDSSTTEDTVKDHCPLCRSPRVGEHSPEMVTKVKYWVAHDKPWAMYALGGFYLRGTGVDQSYALAYEQLEAAADKGYRFAFLQLAHAYETGIGVEKSPEKAATYVGLACEQNDAQAQMLLGKYYMNGFGVSQNDAKANHYYELSCKQGYERALLIYGMKHWSGQGLPFSDVRRARDLLEQIKDSRLKAMCVDNLKQIKVTIEAQNGAAQGDGRHQFNLGGMFGKGRAGLSKSVSTAMFWYIKSVAQGFGQAIPMLALVATMLEESDETPIPEETCFCSLCASLTPRRIVKEGTKGGMLACVCKEAHYCSKEHQRIHWKQHKKEHRRLCKRMEENDVEVGEVGEGVDGGK